MSEKRGDYVCLISGCDTLTSPRQPFCGKHVLADEPPVQQPDDQSSRDTPKHLPPLPQGGTPVAWRGVDLDGNESVTLLRETMEDWVRYGRTITPLGPLAPPPPLVDGGDQGLGASQGTTPSPSADHVAGLDFDALEAIASAAGLLEWTAGFAHWGQADVTRIDPTGESKTSINGIPRNQIADYTEPRFAYHIATFDPPTVLRLIELARAASCAADGSTGPGIPQNPSVDAGLLEARIATLEAALRCVRPNSTLGNIAIVLPDGRQYLWSAQTDSEIAPEVLDGFEGLLGAAAIARAESSQGVDASLVVQQNQELMADSGSPTSRRGSHTFGQGDA